MKLRISKCMQAARPHLEEQPGGFDQFLQNLYGILFRWKSKDIRQKPCSVYLSLFFIYLN